MVIDSVRSGMGREIRFTVEVDPSHEDFAMRLVVIAGDIRLGRTSSTGSHDSGKIE